MSNALLHRCQPVPELIELWAWRLVTCESCCNVAVALCSVYREEISIACSRYVKNVSFKFDATAPSCQTMTR